MNKIWQYHTISKADAHKKAYDFPLKQNECAVIVIEKEVEK